MRGFYQREAGVLALAGLSSALIYAAIMLRLPLLKTYAIPLLNLDNMPRSDWLTGALVLGCAAFLFGAYALGALVVAAGRSRISVPLVVGFALLFVALLLFTHPMTSTDIYDYLFRGRMLARYEANPFVAVPAQFGDDPLLTYVAWRQAPTAYGPLWEGLSWLAARLAGQSPDATESAPLAQLLALMFAYKSLAVLGFLLCGAAIWLALGRAAPEQRRLGLYLWLWNPLALWETVGAAHNDAWMALCIVLALWAFGWGSGVKGQGSGRLDEISSASPSLQISLSSPMAALLALTAGGLIKYVAFFFGPVMLAAALRRLPAWRARVWLLALGGVACVALMVVAYAPFWAGLQTLQNVRDRRTFYTASWLAALQAVLAPALSTEQAQGIIAAAGLALLFAGVVWATYSAWNAPDDVAGHVLWLALWFLFVCNPWFQPWYLIWPLALVAVQPWRQRIVWGVVVFCATAIGGYIAGGWLAPALGLSDKSLGRESLMSALIYLPPLIVLGWARLLGGWRALRGVIQLLVTRGRSGLKSEQGR
jgi:alpha-1,6-mannosyltransferase